MDAKTMQIKKALNSISEIYYYMASPSKEDNILNLILGESPLKHWRFGELVQKSKLTRAAANKWLKKYCDEGLIKQVKENGRFPYFCAGKDNAVYQSKKRLYALEKLYSSGFMQHLAGLKSARTIMVFGSMARGDWYRDSDVDVFIYGSAKGLDKHRYEKELHRKIEVHAFKDSKELHQVRSGLISNVINGYLVKGSVQDFVRVG
jgi:predicted nucleotidyltransferase